MTRESKPASARADGTTVPIDNGSGVEPRALAFNVQRYSIHDGPGIRTTLFLKGCPLHCRWCHNPESISPRVEIGFLPERCIGCGECFKVCPTGARTSELGAGAIRRDLCSGCGRCADACYAEAIERIGYELSVGEALDKVERDRPFYESSGGGVTISGGEPLMRPEFTLAFLAGCRERGLHVALDTCGQVGWDVLAAAASLANLVLFDFKHADSTAHRELTGAGNERILANLGRLLALDDRPEVWIRYPLIPTLNDDPANWRAMGEFLAPFAARPGAGLSVDVLPYHALAESKYRKLGRAYSLAGLAEPTRETVESAAAALAGFGLTVRAGG